MIYNLLAELAKKNIFFKTVRDYPDKWHCVLAYMPEGLILHKCEFFIEQVQEVNEQVRDRIFFQEILIARDKFFIYLEDNHVIL